MSRDKKRQMTWYQVDDTEAIARHLQKMAGKGWLLEGVDNWYYTFRRAEPAQVKYAVTFFPDASVYDPGLTEGQEDYAGYCQAAGWELAAVYGPVQYFRSVRPDPAPIETDEAVKLSAVRRTMRKTFVLTYALLLVLPLMSLPGILRQFQHGPMSFFSSNLSLGNLLLMAVIALYSVGLLLDYLVWVLRSKYAVERGGACVRHHTRARLWATAAMLAVCVIVAAGYLTDQSLKGLRIVFLTFLVIYGGIMLLSRWVLRRLKRGGYSRSKTRGIMIAFAIGAGLVVGFGSVFLFSRLAEAGLIHIGREPVETYTKTYENVSWTYTQNVFYDDLPITLEDLGCTVTPEDHCTYEAEVSRSLLAVHSEYTQVALSSDSELPYLNYQTFTAAWPCLLDISWKGLLKLQKDRYSPMQKLTPAPWGAEEAYQEEYGSLYLLRYPDRIVVLNLWDEAAPEQMEAVVRALRS